jgi:hypothetical protein
MIGRGDLEGPYSLKIELTSKQQNVTVLDLIHVALDRDQCTILVKAFGLHKREKFRVLALLQNIDAP